MPLRRGLNSGTLFLPTLKGFLKTKFSGDAELSGTSLSGREDKNYFGQP